MSYKMSQVYEDLPLPVPAKCVFGGEKRGEEKRGGGFKTRKTGKKKIPLVHILWFQSLEVSKQDCSHASYTHLYLTNHAYMYIPNTTLYHTNHVYIPNTTFTSQIMHICIYVYTK